MVKLDSPQDPRIGKRPTLKTQLRVSNFLSLTPERHNLLKSLRNLLSHHRKLVNVIAHDYDPITGTANAYQNEL